MFLNFHRMRAINKTLANFIPDNTKAKLQNVIENIKDPYNQLEQEKVLDELKADPILMAQMLLQLKVLK
jgi:hypothetical protein